MFGWTGKILKVDLTSGRSWREDIPEELLHGWLGGRGVGVRLMRDFFPLDPSDPEIPIVFAAGPLCATPAPCSSFLSVVSRSPLTRTLFDAPISGTFPLMLKGAGVDALFITGRSATPVFLEIDENDCRISQAGRLWGMDTRETATALAERGSVASIGPAGEVGVLYAGISADGAPCGRGGLGAVMGWKGLKAVVARGGRKPPVADIERLERGAEDTRRLFRASPFLCGELGIRNYSPAALVDLVNQRRMTPTENFRRTWFAGAAAYSAPALKKRYGFRDDPCPGCPIGCMKRDLAGRPFPSFEAISHFGALLANPDRDLILTCCDLCTLLGLDPVSAAASIAAYCEAKGMTFPPGDVPALIRGIARREGECEMLAQGASWLCGVLGKPKCSMTVKGLEMPPYDPRGAYGMALSYAVSPKGASHLAAYTIATEVLRKPVATDRFSFSGKARLVKNAEDGGAAADSLQACRYPLIAASLEEYGEMLSAVTGLEYTSHSLLEAGERVVGLERLCNAENGFTREADRLPERFFLEPGSAGDGMTVPPLDRDRFREELERYYRVREGSGASPEKDALQEGTP